MPRSSLLVPLSVVPLPSPCFTRKSLKNAGADFAPVTQRTDITFRRAGLCHSERPKRVDATERSAPDVGSPFSSRRNVP